MEDFSKYNGEGTNLRKAQLRMVEMLVEFDKICKKNNITYWLDSGTLLGAVRHGGFIPWDDDMDVCVLRSDYKKLRKALMDELPDNLTFVDWTVEKNFFDNCGRVKDKKSRFNYQFFTTQKEQGLYIDIFILEPTFPIIKKMLDPIYGPVFRQVHNFGKEIYQSNIRRVLMKSLSLCLYPIAILLMLLGRSISKLLRAKTLMMTYGMMFLSKRYPKHIFPLKDIVFENHIFNAPCNSDGYLQTMYGDYMKIPPIEERQIHTTNIELF